MFYSNYIIILYQPLKRQSRLQQTTFISSVSLFSEKIILDFSCESFDRQSIHMKPYSLAEDSREIKVKKIKCRLQQFLFGALRDKT